MIEVDIFWSYAIGAGFAAFAGPLLRKEVDWAVNSYFVYTLCFLSMIFAPSGIYLLWAFPGWESMFLFKRQSDIHAILPCVFTATNVLLGVLGFNHAYQAIRRGKYLYAHRLWVRAYACMFAVLGFGYRRFLYPGTGSEWASGVPYELVSFVHSSVFKTLLAMGVIFIPTLLVPMSTWLRTNERNKAVSRKDIRRVVLGELFVCMVACTLGYLTFIHVIATPTQRAYFVDGPAGYYAPLAGCATAFGALAVILGALLTRLV